MTKKQGEKEGEKPGEVEETPRTRSVLASLKSYAGRLKAAPPRTSLRVLIVDDEEPIRRFVERVLREAGHETTTAADATEAIDLAKKSAAFDVLVTDLMMPGITGDELARRLRQGDPKLKVLYLTGFSDRLFMEKTTLWQDEAFLEKPCSVKGLKEAVSLLFFGQIESPPPG